MLACVELQKNSDGNSSGKLRFRIALTKQVSGLHKIHMYFCTISIKYDYLFNTGTYPLGVFAGVGYGNSQGLQPTSNCPSSGYTHLQH